MSVLFECEFGWIISHENYVKNIYKNVQFNFETRSFQFKQLLFNIKSPYLRHNQNNQTKNYEYNLKRKKKKCNSNINFEEFINEVKYVECTYKLFKEKTNFMRHFVINNLATVQDNKLAQNEADDCYNVIDKIQFKNSFGSNGETPVIQTVNDAQFLFPKNCRFFCKNINEMNNVLNNEEQFDVILLDPPWWNKYIRRKNAKGNQGYQMMYNLDLSVIPINKILTPNGLIIVWCTNSPQHLKDLREEIFPKWGIKFIAKWYWLKVTDEGIPICSFSEPPGKQPFEQIIFGVQENNERILIPHGKIILSIPSALHSHKPPLADLLSRYMGNKQRCLEIFARYLLPGWSSWGLEVLKLQHKYLYQTQC